MRRWALYRKNQPKFAEGTAVICFIYEEDGKICREDRLESELSVPEGLPKNCLGWWRATARAKPPTQRQLNERLERLFLGFKEADTKTEETPDGEDLAASSKDALIWLVGLYLTRKRIVRQDGTTFTHIKSGESLSISDPDALDPEMVQAAMGELMEAIS